MTEKNQLPKDWKWVKLGKACEVITGTTPPRSDLSNYGADVPFFKPPHLWDGVINDTDEKLSFKGSKKARVVPPNTVLVTCIGNLGRTGFIKKNAAFNQQINAILENENIEGKFIFYQAQSPLFKKQLEKLATGTTVSIVNKGNFETIDIPLPPKPTQQAIVSKIEELFSELDKGIENLYTAQQQLKTFRQSVLKCAFEGRLTEEWRKKHSEIDNASEVLNSIKQLREKKAKELGKKLKTVPDLSKDELSKLPDLPVHWIWVKIIETVFNTSDDIVDGPFGSNLKNSDYVEGAPIPVISISNIEEGFKSKIRYITEEKFETIKRSAVYPGDIIVAKIGSTYGKTGVYPEWMPIGVIPANLLRIRPSNHFSKKLLIYYLKSAVFKKRLDSIMKSTAQPAYNVSMFKELPIPFMSREEQNEVIKEIESRLSVADKMEETINQSLEQAEALRQSILKKSFEGRLV